MCKCNWRFANERDAFWTKVISGKYKEEEGGWWSCEVRDGYGVELWKSIRKERNTFLGHLSFMVGNGRRVKFWMDKWCGDEPSCVSFPSLKVAWVADLWVQTGERDHCNPCFTRALNDWKVDKVEDLFLRLQGKTVDSVGEDTIVWMNLYNNKFFVKYLYVALEPRDLVSFPKQIVWNSWVSSKVNFFVWGAS